MLLLYISISIIYVMYVLIIVHILSNWNFNKANNIEKSDLIIPISIVIAARNEAKNLPIILQSLERLNYNKDFFEIIIVNDHSEDDTLQVAKEYALKNLVVLDLRSNLKGKKHALSYGIHKAKNELIVCTDADCIVPDNWLVQIANNYAIEQWKFCAMPVKFNKSNSCFEYFQTMDFLGLMGVTNVANKRNYFYMANGANMAFAKSAFEEVGGFEANLDRVSGDDMFLVKAIAERFQNSVGMFFNEEVLVSTSPEQTISDFLHQRFRWGSKNKSIESREMNITMLVVWLASFLLIVQSFLLVMKWSGLGLGLLMISLTLKVVVDNNYLKRLSQDFNIEYSLFKFLCSFGINTMYTTFLAPLTIFSMPFNWKLRKH